MVVFPSPHPDDPKYGIRLVAIRHGVFKDHRNIGEAQEIARAVIQHMRGNPTESLGVVAMNNQQSEFIADEVERLVKHDPQAQTYLDSFNSHPEPFFVKNLENVQGDERDVIFISFTYGPSAPGGQVYQRFGPINSNVGWRRLNVLFTRAKNRILAFSSMSTSDIRGGPGVSEGVRALKNYLAYAETGILEQARETGRPPGSDFEVSVADALRVAGYECEAQVGIAGFFIDIAVRHPELPGQYLLGVECDGATYHSARSVRDRDRLRQAALENLGWIIHRIWSVDWFRDPHSEIRRVVGKLDQLREQTSLASLSTIGEGKSQSIKDTTSKYEGITDKQTGIGFSDTQNDVKPRVSLLTENQAREMLIELRDKTIKIEIPDSDPTGDILGSSMLDALLRYRPKSMDEFRRKTPFELREKLNPRQVAKYHGDIFSILARTVGSYTPGS